MNIEELQVICKSNEAVTESIKWGNDLCFCIGEKMFLVVGLDKSPTSAAFKVLEEQFEEISSREGFKPAPYTARYKWVMINDIKEMTKKEWQFYIEQSYSLVKDKLSVKIKKQLGFT